MLYTSRKIDALSRIISTSHFIGATFKGKKNCFFENKPQFEEGIRAKGMTLFPEIISTYIVAAKKYRYINFANAHLSSCLICKNLEVQFKMCHIHECVGNLSFSKNSYEPLWTTIVRQKIGFPSGFT